MSKARAARDALLASHPSADVSIVQMDVSSLPSVVRGAKEVKQKYVSFGQVAFSRGSAALRLIQ